MKANELMLGDYISVKPSKMPIKIAAVHHKKVAYHTCTNRLTWIRESLLEPIPLTIEILKKNGFKYKEGETGMFGVITAPHYICDGVPFEVFCDGEPFAIWFKEPINIKYVHQLQHALRLCEIEKEIIL